MKWLGVVGLGVGGNIMFFLWVLYNCLTQFVDVRAVTDQRLQGWLVRGLDRTCRRYHKNVLCGCWGR